MSRIQGSCGQGKANEVASRKVFLRASNACWAPLVHSNRAILPTNVSKEVPQGNRHKLAEGAWRPGETKWHPGKLEDAASGAESGLLLGTVGHLELPITTEQVKRDIEFRVREVVEGIMDVWDGIGIFLEQGVDSLVVYAKPEGPILLFD